MPIRWRVKDVWVLVCTLCCFAVCATASGDETERQALSWLANQVSDINASLPDTALFIIATGYHVLDGAPSLQKADGLATERVLAAMEQIVAKGQWTNDQYATMCLLGAWTRYKYPGHPVVSSAKDLSSALIRTYVGGNATTEALLALPTEMSRRNKQIAVPTDIPASIEGLTLSALVSRHDAVPLTILLTEYIRRTPADSLMSRRWLANIVAKVSSAWDNEDHCFRFPDSPHGPYRDTCIALIILGGYYGSGPVHSRGTLGTGTENGVSNTTQEPEPYTVDGAEGEKTTE